MRYLLRSPIWGVYQECSLGELLGGALSLAAGGDGRPTLEPALAGLPPLRITESLRESVRGMPYFIATGEPLGQWLAYVFARLGVRAELLGRRSGHVDVFLRDIPPVGRPVPMTIRPGSGPSASNAVLSGIRQSGAKVLRGTLLDGMAVGESVRLGQPTPPVGDLLFAAGIDVDEAGYLAEFDGQRSSLGLNGLRLVTAQPGLHPGRLLKFTDRSVSGAKLWQVSRVWHGAAAGRYRNTVDLAKSGVSWRPALPRIQSPVTMTGKVDDGRSKPGAIVARDRLGRIPVQVSAMAIGGDAENAESMSNPPCPAPVRINLSVVGPMAGGVHGWVPSHRQGDVCRVRVHHPMWAEVEGFVYGYQERLGKNLVDASAAVVTGNLEERWSGLVFRPWADVDDEDRAEQTAWRANAPSATGAGKPPLEADPKDADQRDQAAEDSARQTAAEMQENQPDPDALGA